MNPEKSLNDHQLNIKQDEISLQNIPVDNDLNLDHSQNNSQNIYIFTIIADKFNNDDIKNQNSSNELNMEVISDQKSTNQSEDFGSRSNLDQLIKYPLLDSFNPKPGFFQKLIHSRDSKTLKEYIFSPVRCIINDRDSSGCTALHIALLNSYPEMLEILLSCQSVDLRPNDETENTCIAGDSSSDNNGYQNNDIIQIDLSIPYAGIPISHLVLCKAIFPERYDDCLNCLYLLLPFTLTHGTSQSVSWLDINATDQLGVTALHLACSFGDSKIVSLLLEYGALANISDLNNDEPVHYAISSRDPDTLSIILSSGGADPLKKSTCTANLIKCCIDKSAWRCLHTLLTDSEYQQHPISESEYDLLSFHAQKLGLGSEFERVFSLAVEIATNDDPNQRGRGIGGHENLIVDGPSMGLASTRIFTHGCCIDHISLPEPMDMPIRRSKLVNKIPENPTRMEVLVKPNVGVLKSSEFSLLQWTESCKPAILSDILRVHDWAYVRLLQHKVEESRLIWDQRPFFTGSIDDDTQLTPGSWKAALHASGSVINAVDCVCRGENRNAFCAIRPPGHHLGTWGAAQTVGTDEGIPSGSQGFCLLNNIAIGAAYCRYMYSSLGISKIAIIDFDVHHGNGTEQIVRNVSPGSRKIKTLFNPVPGINLNLEQDISYYKIWRDELDAENIFFSSVHAYDGTFYPGTGPDQCITKPNIINIGLAEKTTSKIFRNKIKRFLLPKLLQFRPDIIFISAGFDGHIIDIVGKGFTSCTEGDYAWLTQQLISIANLCCNGRIVSVLEGGYNTKALSLSPLAKSVAAHVRTLHWTSPNLMPNPQEWEDELLTEDNEDLENEDDDITGHRDSDVFNSYTDNDLITFGNSNIDNCSTDNLNHLGSSNHYVIDTAGTASYSPSLKRYKSHEKSEAGENPSSNNDSSSAELSNSQMRSYEVQNNASNVIRPKRAAAIKAEENIQKKIQSELDSSKQIIHSDLSENI